MTNDELTIAFYKGSAIHEVLQRFKFKEEEKLIRDAIRTTNMDIPRMKLIHDADELLKEVAKIRAPLETETKTNVDPKALAHIEAMSLKQKHSSSKYDEKIASESRLRSFDGKFLKVYAISLLIAFIIYDLIYE